MISLFGLEGRFPIGVWYRIAAGAIIVLCVAVLFRFGGSYDSLDTPIVGMLAGLVAFAGALLLAGAVAELRDDWRTEKIRKERLSRLGEPLTIKVAQISSDLVPLIDELPRKARENGLLRIVGYDGNYIHSRYGNRWKTSLVRWLREGLTIEYILTKPGLKPESDVTSAYRELLSQEDETTQERMNILCVRENGSKKDCENSGIDREFLKSRHPTLFRGDVRGSESGGIKTVKAMWIEGIHDPGSSVAYGVTYVSPKAMGIKDEEEYDSYDRAMDSLKEDCDVLY